MPNALYPTARAAFGNGGIAWLTDDIRAVLVDATYVYSDLHDFLDDVVAGNRVATSASMTGKTNVLGVFDADDLVFTAVTGDVVKGVIIYKHTGVEATSQLILFYDSTAASVAITVTPDGNSIRVRWSAGPLKIFRL